jgi:hypothetical protein
MGILMVTIIVTFANIDVDFIVWYINMRMYPDDRAENPFEAGEQAYSRLVFDEKLHLCAHN